MKSILVTGGELPDYKYIEDFLSADYVCVADSGFDWVLKNNMKFDLVVGDMDSVKSKVELQNIPPKKIKLLPKDKDDTDTVYGLRVLHNMNPDTVTLIGGGGGRLDHLLGVFSLFSSKLSPNIWITSREIVYKINGRFSLSDYIGSSISVFPLNKDVCSIGSYGLKWELSTVDWEFKSIGISNSVVKENAWIDTGTQEVLVILPITGNKFE